MKLINLSSTMPIFHYNTPIPFPRRFADETSIRNLRRGFKVRKGTAR